MMEFLESYHFYYFVRITFACDESTQIKDRNLPSHFVIWNGFSEKHFERLIPLAGMTLGEKFIKKKAISG